MTVRSFLRTLGLSGISSASLAFGITYLSSQKGEKEEIKLGEVIGVEDPIEKVGLDCGDVSDLSGESNGVDCRLNGREKFNVEQGEIREEDVVFDDQRTIRLHRNSSNYEGGFRFAIEKGNIDLKRKNGNGDSGDLKIARLEEYESYEIKKDGEVYYLSRKTNSREGMILNLGLPGSCSLPATGNSTCSISPEQIKRVRFENNSKEITSSGNTSLTISKTSEESFYGGYRFIFSFPGDMEIAEKIIKANSRTDFRIKRREDGQLSLESAWSEEELIGKVGLRCEDEDCKLKDNETLKVKWGKDKFEVSSLGSGKIKLHRNSENYPHGFRFEIEGNIISGDKKLEEYEDYELKEFDGQYFLTRRVESSVKLGKLLNLPKGCTLPSSGSKICDKLKGNDLKGINFHGKDGNHPTVPDGKEVKITISKIEGTDFPLGYKFSVESSGDLSISNGLTVRANTPTEFKIKREEGENLSLERAWSLSTLAEKVGLNCGGDECTIKSSKLNLKREKSILIGASRRSGETKGKIKLIENQANYREGFKFLIQESDINLTSGNNSGMLGEFESYEIREEGGKYYFFKKTTAIKEKWGALGLTGRCSNSVSSNGCQIYEGEFRNIKFFGRNPNGSITIPGGTRVYLKSYSTADPNHPMGIKIVLEVRDGEIKIPKDSGSIILWKNSEIEFKVRKESDNSYSLEKAININELVKKIGIANGNCTDEGGCTVGPTINVRENNGRKYQKNAKVKIKDQAKKITYKEGKNGGFNMNIIFTVEEKIEVEYKAPGVESLGNITFIKPGTYEIKDGNIGGANGSVKATFLSEKESFTFEI